MYVKRLIVEEGFLDGLDLEFTTGLNVLIGGRGTGKTSVIELIRYCVDVPAITQSNEEDPFSHAISVLAGGQVTVIAQQENHEIVLRRSAGDPAPKVRTSINKPVILSQKEVERVGLDARGRLRLVDEFLEHQGVANEKHVISEIQSRSAEITALLLEVSEMAEELAQSPEVQDGLWQWPNSAPLMKSSTRTNAIPGRSSDCQTVHTAPLLIWSVSGAATRAGAFYRLLEGFDENLYELVAHDGNGALQVLKQMREAFDATWLSGSATSHMLIRDIRRTLMADVTFGPLQQKLDGLAWQDFEGNRIPVRWCCQHGDLHGGNILTGQGNRFALIDFGRVGQGPSCLDPVSLEFGLLWHPSGRAVAAGWPDQDATSNWLDVDTYFGNSPFPKFMKELRSWALSTCAGSQELLATVYSLAVRQLAFPDCDIEKVRRVVACCTLSLDR